jgi:hypothetical protein
MDQHGISVPGSTRLTCKMANLCISPVQAGIISFRTPNSSFILDLLRRSIKLWAVFLAILRPATLVDEGCFFLEGGAFPEAFLGPSANVSTPSSGCSLGFIWMILRERVGGGGKAKESLLGGFWAREERRRILTTSLAGRTGDWGETGRYEEAEDCLVDELDGLDSAVATAGGGSSKDNCREENWEPSLPLISVEDAGVGGGSGRGILAAGQLVSCTVANCSRECRIVE